MNLLKFFSKNKTSEQITPLKDASRIEDENKMLKAMMSSPLSEAFLTQFFTGDKVGAGLNYPSLVGFDYTALRNRSRKARFDTPQAAAAVQRMMENVINSGLTLESTPIWELLNSTLSKKEQISWTKKVEWYWRIYANSKSSSYDKKKTFQQNQSVWYKNYLRDGEIFLILRYSTDKNLLNPLTIQEISPENIQNPVSADDFAAIKSRGNTVLDGIEYASSGEEVAYFVYNPVDYSITRVEKVGKQSKRLFVIHAMNSEYAGQTRGIPFLTGVLHELQKVSDYSLLELQAAVINAIIAVWIEPAADANSSQPFGGVQLKTAQPEDANMAVEKQPANAAFNKGGLIVQNLKKGEKLASYDTKRPNVNFDAFTTAIIKNLSSSLSIPMEVLTMTFGQNYSASRATLILFWNSVIQERSNFEADILDPIFEAWMIGEIDAGRVQASGFTDSKLLRAAWLNNRWIGISQPSIDPLKEANAVGVRLEQGLTTREIESQKYNGTSFSENIEKLKEENKQLQESVIEKATATAKQNSQKNDEDQDN